MPSTSKKQHDFMEAIAHNKAFAKKVGVSQSVGKDFSEADKGKKFASGGRADRQVANVKKTNHGQEALFKGGGMATKKMAEARMMPAKMEKVKDTMSAKKGGAKKDKPMGSAKMGKVGRMSFAKGGGIESKGKTKGKVC